MLRQLTFSTVHKALRFFIKVWKQKGFVTTSSIRVFEIVSLFYSDGLPFFSLFTGLQIAFYFFFPVFLERLEAFLHFTRLSLKGLVY